MRVFPKVSFFVQIVAHFYAHTHTDSFRLFMDDESHEPVGLAFIAPSITPLAWVRKGVNPSFRAYDYDPQNRVIKDYTQYYVPLDKLIDTDDDDDYPEEDDQDYKDDYDDDEPSKKKSRRKNNLGKRFAEVAESDIAQDITTIKPSNFTASNDTSDAKDDTVAPTTIAPNSDHDLDVLVNSWEFAYDAAMDFNLESMSVKSMYKVYLSIKDYPQNETFKMYWRHAFVKRDTTDGLDCDENCKKVVICSFTHVRKDEFKDCLVESGIPHEATPPNIIPTTTSTPTTTSSSMPTTTKTFTTPTTTSLWQKVSWATTKSPEVGINVTNKFNSNDGRQKGSPYRIVNGVAIGVALIILVALITVGIIKYRRMRRRRYCSQEFLLDSFRYDGYSQLDQP